MFLTHGIACALFSSRLVLYSDSYSRSLPCSPPVANASGCRRTRCKPFSGCYCRFSPRYGKDTVHVGDFIGLSNSSRTSTLYCRHKLVRSTSYVQNPSSSARPSGKAKHVAVSDEYVYQHNFPPSLSACTVHYSSSAFRVARTAVLRASCPPCCAIVACRCTVRTSHACFCVSCVMVAAVRVFLRCTNGAVCGLYKAGKLYLVHSQGGWCMAMMCRIVW